MNDTIDTFIKQIMLIETSNEGEFKCQAYSYLNKMQEDLAPVYGDVRAKLHEIEHYLQLVSTWNVEATRARILKDAHYLKDLKMAHQQDWESAFVPDTMLHD